MKHAKLIRRVLLALVLLPLAASLLIAGGLFWFLWESKEVGAGYCAKLIATGVFVLGRDAESVRQQELGFLPWFHYEVDYEGKTVTGWVFPSVKRTAVYREGLGVALALDGDIDALRAQARPDLIPDLSALKEQPWPMGDAPSGKPVPEDYDKAKLDGAVEGMFAEPNPWHKRNTRAVMVVYQNEVVAERYAPGFGPEQRLAAWSVTKSIFHALYGIAVRDGKVDIHERAPVPAWQGAGDPRAQITLDMLLRMSSGIDFTEVDYTPPAQLTTMLFDNPGAAEYFMSLPLAFPPDTHWAYGSGTTNLLSWVLRQRYDEAVYYALPYQEIFSKIGMRSAVIEADATGTYVGSSYLHATARDYARFGLLYLHDGVWQGERILPEGWADYAMTATPTAPKNNYGAHWWRPTLDDRAAAEARGVPLPDDVFNASGFEGQKIVVIPSRQLVIVRLGVCYFSQYPFYDQVCDILEAFPR
ncbi:MAG: serine hydrolase [Candidatus Hydrogenedens sp.]|nr:serine hydrolase [Candidatus Hydrogenedens sp.]